MAFPNRRDVLNYVPFAALPTEFLFHVQGLLGDFQSFIAAGAQSQCIRVDFGGTSATKSETHRIS